MQKTLSLEGRSFALLARAPEPALCVFEFSRVRGVTNFHSEKRMSQSSMPAGCLWLLIAREERCQTALSSATLKC